jgi:hypothetical protein
MDEISRGIATAALTLQSVLLQALVSKGVLTPGEALEVVDEGLDAVTHGPRGKDADPVKGIALSCLEGVREELKAIASDNTRKH